MNSHLLASDLKVLLGKQGTCVSIFMPTHRVVSEAQEDRIRLKNLLRRAEDGLEQMTKRRPEVKKLLEPASKLVDDLSFWQQQSDGLALFLSPGLFRYYRVPLSFKELAQVGPRFLIKPMLPLFLSNGKFYLLALSQDGVRLFQGDRLSIHELELTGIPPSKKEALKYDEPVRTVSYHTGEPGKGKQAAVFHGQDIGDIAKTNTLRYFYLVDKGLHEVLKEEKAPLVLAAVDYLHPIYQQANTYPHLLKEGLHGSPEMLNPSVLHQRAWDILQPYFDRERQKDVDRYYLLAGTGRTSKELAEILPEAKHGHLDILFVALDREQWGSFDPASGRVELHAKAEPGDEDLLDLAAGYTIASRGRVYAVEQAKLPNGSLASAIRRTPIG